MGIAERLRIQRPPVEEIRIFSVLCDQIEHGVKCGEDVSAPLAQWNARASRVYGPSEFTTYYGAVSTEVFVEEALLPQPPWIQDITFGSYARCCKRSSRRHCPRR